METLLEGRCEMPFYTDLRLVFQSIGNRQREFNWLITDLEYSCFTVQDDCPVLFEGSGPFWVTGDELSRLVAEYELQFIWAVLSGFPPGVSIDLKRLKIVPYADGNPGFWVPEPRIQHPLAEIEIVCWDSKSTLLLSRV